jgi:MFS family permease
MNVKKNIKLMQLFYFFTGLPFSAAIQVIYFSQVSGSYALAMSVYSVVMISSAVFEVPTGVFSDFIGRKKTSILGALALLAAVVLYAAANSYSILVVGALFEGLSRSLFSGNDNALLYDTLKEVEEEEKFDHYLGRLGASEQLALAIAAILGGLLALRSLKFVMWMSVIPIAVLVVISFLYVDTKRHAKESGNIFHHLKAGLVKFRDNYRLKLLSASSVTGYAFGESSFQFSPIFVNSLWPIWAVGIARFISFGGASVSYYFSGKILKKIDALKFLVLNNIFGRITNSLAFLFPSVASPVLMNLTAFTYGTHQVARESLIQKEFTSSERATMSSINAFFGSLLFGVVSFLLGIFADGFEPRFALLIIQLFLLIPLFINLKLFRYSAAHEVKVSPLKR